MTNAVHLAVRDALAQYIAAQLAASHPTLKVSSEWPAAGKPLPDEAITVLLSGTIEEAGYAPDVISVTPTGGANADVLYGYGTVTLGMQLDCWAHYPATRDQLAFDLEAAINRPPALTLGVSTAPQFGRQRGLVILVPDLFNCPADYRFDATTSPVENGDVAQTGEWRATWSGQAFVHLVNQESFALVKRLLLTGSLTNPRLTPP